MRCQQLKRIVPNVFQAGIVSRPSMWISFSIAAVRSVGPRYEVQFVRFPRCGDQPSLHVEWLDSRRQESRELAVFGGSIFRRL